MYPRAEATGCTEDGYVLRILTGSHLHLNFEACFACYAYSICQPSYAESMEPYTAHYGGVRVRCKSHTAICTFQRTVIENTSPHKWDAGLHAQSLCHPAVRTAYSIMGEPVSVEPETEIIICYFLCSLQRKTRKGFIDLQKIKCVEIVRNGGAAIPCQNKYPFQVCPCYPTITSFR